MPQVPVHHFTEFRRCRGQPRQFWEETLLFHCPGSVENFLPLAAGAHPSEEAADQNTCGARYSPKTSRRTPKISPMVAPAQPTVCRKVETLTIPVLPNRLSFRR